MITVEQQIVELEIEKASYQEVIKQFTKGCDARMETSLDEFLCGIEDKIEDINRAIAQLVRAQS